MTNSNDRLIFSENYIYHNDNKIFQNKLLKSFIINLGCKDQNLTIA